MTLSRVDIGGATVELPADWADISDDGDDLMSLAKQDGVGALQFSIAEYVDGVDPNIDHDGLLGLLRAFAEGKRYGEPHGIARLAGAVRGVSGDFTLPKHRLRVWYLSDGRNVALVTYVVLAEHRAAAEEELREASSIAHSLLFY